MSNQIPADLVECAREMSATAVKYHLRNFHATLTPGGDHAWQDPVDVMWVHGGHDADEHKVTVTSKMHVQVDTSVPKQEPYP